MAQSSREWEESILQLQKLIPVGKRAKCNPKHAQHADAELERIDESRAQDGLWVEAMCPQQVHEPCQSEIEVDMLQTQQDGKQYPAVEKRRLLPCHDHRQHQDPVQKAIVLEVYVIDNE